MGRLLSGVTDQITEILIGIIEFCLKHMFTDINNCMQLISNLAGFGPATIMPEAFVMIKKLSDDVMLPISSVIISFVLSYELISMVIDKNNMNDIGSESVKKSL